LSESLWLCQSQDERYRLLTRRASHDLGLVGAVEEISDAEARSVFAADVPGLLTVLRAALPETHRARRAAGS
jgi:hypothetical protein